MMAVTVNSETLPLDVLEVYGYGYEREVDIMRKGVVVLQEQASTLELRGQADKVLTTAGFNCESRQRFDGTMIVAFQRPEDQPDSSVEEVEGLLRGNVLLESAPFLIKAQD